MRRREEELQKKRDEKRRVEEEVSFSQMDWWDIWKRKVPIFNGKIDGCRFSLKPIH
jgi:hypothetical protein